MSKLLPIAEVIKTLLEDKFGQEVKYYLEVQKEWLLNTPNKSLYEHSWEDISSVYSALVDNKWTLDERISLLDADRYGNMAKIDIWFDKPYNFILEFDERQHFNQFRLKTLEKNYKNFDYSFKYDEYIALSKRYEIKPGKSGFQKLRSEDVLFPEMFNGDKQDNRTRQRAFRDFLKDIIPVKLGFNPTVRINFKVTGGRIKNFDNTDLNNIKKYLDEINAFNKIIII